MHVNNFRTIKDSLAVSIKGWLPQGFCQDSWVVTYADGRQERIKHIAASIESEVKSKDEIDKVVEAADTRGEDMWVYFMEYMTELIALVEADSLPKGETK